MEQKKRGQETKILKRVASWVKDWVPYKGEGVAGISLRIMEEV